jgi:hypothetical protein
VVFCCSACSGLQQRVYAATQHGLAAVDSFALIHRGSTAMHASSRAAPFGRPTVNVGRGHGPSFPSTPRTAARPVLPGAMPRCGSLRRTRLACCRALDPVDPVDPAAVTSASLASQPRRPKQAGGQRHAESRCSAHQPQHMADPTLCAAFRQPRTPWSPQRRPGALCILSLPSPPLQRAHGHLHLPLIGADSERNRGPHQLLAPWPRAVGPISQGNDAMQLAGASVPSLARLAPSNLVTCLSAGWLQARQGAVVWPMQTPHRSELAFSTTQKHAAAGAFLGTSDCRLRLPTTDPSIPHLLTATGRSCISLLLIPPAAR